MVVICLFANLCADRQQGQSSIFRPRLLQRHTCPGERNWSGLPPGIAIDVHVVARGNTDNLRITLKSLAQACYPEVSVLFARLLLSMALVSPRAILSLPHHQSNTSSLDKIKIDADVAVQPARKGWCLQPCTSVYVPTLLYPLFGPRSRQTRRSQPRPCFSCCMLVN